MAYDDRGERCCQIAVLPAYPKVGPQDDHEIMVASDPCRKRRGQALLLT